MSSRGRIAVSVSNTVTLSLRLVTLYKSYRSHGSDGKGVDLLRTVWINIHAATREQRPVSNEKVIHVMIKVGKEVDTSLAFKSISQPYFRNRNFLSKDGDAPT
jgi:hypothetical protein